MLLSSLVEALQVVEVVVVDLELVEVDADDVLDLLLLLLHRPKIGIIIEIILLLYLLL